MSYAMQYRLKQVAVVVFIIVVGFVAVSAIMSKTKKDPDLIALKSQAIATWVPFSGTYVKGLEAMYNPKGFMGKPSYATYERLWNVDGADGLALVKAAKRAAIDSGWKVTAEDLQSKNPVVSLDKRQPGCRCSLSITLLTDQNFRTDDLTPPALRIALKNNH